MMRYIWPRQSLALCEDYAWQPKGQRWGKIGDCHEGLVKDHQLSRPGTICQQQEEGDGWWQQSAGQLKDIDGRVRGRSEELQEELQHATVVNVGGLPRA